MESKKILFTAGQFAKLHNINKRTLHYYDSINLFSPEQKGANGYRYYTYLQSPILEMILTLRELDMTIDEIEKYMKNRSNHAFRNIIKTKTNEIDDSIKKLKAIRKLLEEKENLLTFSEQVDTHKIEIINCPDEYLLLSKPFSGSYNDNDYAVLIEHMQSFRDHRLYNKTYGCMILSEKIIKRNFDQYDCFFTKIKKPNKKSDLFLKPKGSYITAYCKGNWDNLPKTYRQIINFAKKNGLTLSGYAYETGINEMTINTIDEYITQIMICCKPRNI